MASQRFNNKQIIDTQSKEVQQAIRTWFQFAEAESLRFYKRSFTNQGFTNNALVRWAPRKKQQAWPILVKTGKLLNSIRILSRGKNYFIIGTDLKYADYHNEGTNRLPQRQFIGESNTLAANLLAKLDRAIKSVFK